MNIMLFSNGKLNGNDNILQYGAEWIKPMMEKTKPKKLVFIPYAVIRGSYAERTEAVQAAFQNYDCDIVGIHETDDPVEAIKQADGVIISGGNTWVLNRMMHDQGLIKPIRQAVIEQNKLFIGWSAGTNVATPTIRTTNDMPIVSAAILPSLNLVPFQINPHYIEASISGHLGETRDERIEEFLAINQSEVVVGIAEGTMLQLSDGKLTYHSATGQPMKFFEYDKPVVEFNETSELDFLLTLGC